MLKFYAHNNKNNKKIESIITKAIFYIRSKGRAGQGQSAVNVSPNIPLYIDYGSPTSCITYRSCSVLCYQEFIKSQLNENKDTDKQICTYRKCVNLTYVKKHFF